jgi:hypothetical protein
MHHASRPDLFNRVADTKENTGMIQPSVSQEALDALAAFQAYAARTLLVLDLIVSFFDFRLL